MAIYPKGLTAPTTGIVVSVEQEPSQPDWKKAGAGEECRKKEGRDNSVDLALMRRHESGVVQASREAGM